MQNTFWDLGTIFDRETLGPLWAPIFLSATLTFSYVAILIVFFQEIVLKMPENIEKEFRNL